MLTRHGIHDLPVGELALEGIAVGEDDVELDSVSMWRLMAGETGHTHLFCFSLPSLPNAGGSVTLEDTTARADLVKKFCVCQHGCSLGVRHRVRTWMTWLTLW